jgi:[ribosomal protein S18]-alanine N-acetyltransferase
MSFGLRQAVPGDAAALLTLEALFPTDRLPMRSIRRLLRSESARVWVVQEGGTCVGNLVMLLRARSQFARIYSLVVAPQARGRGVAQALIHAAEAEAIRCGRVRMRLEVRVDNAPAQALYARLGYDVEGILPGYYEDGGDGLRLVRPL